MTQPYPYPTSYPLPPLDQSHDHLVKPEPVPLQHQNSPNSSYSSGYRSTSASTASTANTSEPSQPPDSSHSAHSTQSNNTAGAAALLHQHQANQHAFRSNSGQRAFVFQNASGSSYDARPGFNAPSRESSASSTRGSDAGGPFKSESDYDPFRIKHRRRTSPPQLKILEHHFELNPKPDVGVRKSLSEQLDMTPREVQVWFQNRRAKVKKLKERADRDAATASREGTSPPARSYDSSPSALAAAPPDLLPLPPNVFPVAQPYPSRTIYGQDVVSQQRMSPPASYPSMSYSSQAQAGPVTLAPQHPHLPLSPESHPHPYGPSGAYQSTVYTTTVASSTYATNEYLPGSGSSGPPSFPLLPHEHYASRRYSMPALNAEHPAWSNPPTIPEPPSTSDGFPHYQPPSTTAFASSALSTSVPPSAILASQSTSYPSFPSYSYAPSSIDPGYPHERRSSHASDSLLYETHTSQPPSTYSIMPTVPVSASYDPATSSSSYLPVHATAPTDPFSSFDPLAPVSTAPPSLTTSALLEESSSSLSSSGSGLIERRSSIAQQHRQSNRLKPYDQNERRSPGSTRSPHSQ